MKSEECGVWYITKGEGYFSIPAVVRLEINPGNGYREEFTVYKKIIIYFNIGLET